jgi:chloramphenicol 3-O-phosphotransferase
VFSVIIHLIVFVLVVFIIWATLRSAKAKKRGTVIIFIGASSAGKTSLVREFINLQYPEKLFISTGVDQSFFALGSSTKIIVKKEWVNGSVNFSYTTDIDGSPIVDLSMGSIGDVIQRINYDFGAMAADSGLHVLVDEVILNDDTFEYLLNVAKHHDVYVVSVYAPLMLREERERARPLRFLGHTRSQELRAYQFRGHDLFREGLCDLALETHMHDSAECASILASFIKHNAPRAVHVLRDLPRAVGFEQTANHQEAEAVRRYPFVKDSRPVAFLLIGASSAGKTTLAKAIMDDCYPEKIFLSAGIDDIFRALGDETVPLRRDYWVDGEINYQHGVDEHGKPTVAISLGDLGEKLMCLAYDRACSFLDAGFNVVIDDVLLSDHVFEYALSRLKNYRVFVVGVYAPLEVREDREKERKNRLVGHTRSQEAQAYTYRGVNMLKKHMFDLVVNTSQEDVSHAVKRLQMHAMSNQPQAIFDMQKL